MEGREGGRGEDRNTVHVYMYNIHVCVQAEVHRW